MPVSFVFTNLILVGSLNGFLLAILLLVHPKFRKTSNIFLALFLFSFSLNNVFYTFYDLGVIDSYPILSMAPLSLTFLISISFYFFVQYLINPAYKLVRKDYFLFGLVVFQFGFHLLNMLFYLFSAGYRTKATPFVNWLDNTVEEILAMVIGLMVLIVVIRKLNRFQDQLKGHYSEISRRSLSWLRNLTLGLCFIWTLWAIPGIYEIYTGNATNAVHYPMWICFSIVIYWIGYSALLRNDVFDTPDFPVVEDEVKSMSANADQHFERLVSLMESQHLYQNPKLTLSELAERTDLSPGYLSQIINQKSGSHFFDFVNHYRVEDAKRKFSDPQFDHYSVLAIGLEGGFNSKSTFNAVFKKQTGKTPSSYRKGLSQQLL